MCDKNEATKIIKIFQDINRRKYLFRESGIIDYKLWQLAVPD